MNSTEIVAACGAALIASVAVGAVASPVSAKSPAAVVYAPDPERVTKRVSYADLDLASEAGAKSLNRRVRSAVSNVCLRTVGNDTGPERFTFHSCRSFALSGAKPQIASAVQRSREMAATGRSSIAAAAIVITLPE